MLYDNLESAKLHLKQEKLWTYHIRMQSAEGESKSLRNDQSKALTVDCANQIKRGKPARAQKALIQQ